VAVVAHEVDDESDDAAEDEKRDEEYPAGLKDAIAADAGRVGHVEAAEHGDYVVADGGVCSKADTAEEVDQVMLDDGVIVGVDAAKEDDYVVVGVAGDVGVSEKDDEIVIDGTDGVDAAEETDGVVDGTARGHEDVGAKLDFVIIGVGRGGSEREGREQKGAGENTVEVHGASLLAVRAGPEKSSGKIGWNSAGCPQVYA